MRLLLIVALLYPAATLSFGQETPSPAPVATPPLQEPVIQQPQHPPAPPPNPALPDSPGAALPTYHQSITVTTPASVPCKPGEKPTATVVSTDGGPPRLLPPCTPVENRSPYQRFLNYSTPLPLTPRQKGLLALHNLTDPGNLFTITANAGFTVGINPRTAYGPGWKGFGRDVGFSLSQDATGEFFSTFLFDSLFHQDPHYHRMPQGTIPRRLLHAVSHTVISQHDDGTPMPNYSTLLTYPVSAEIANLYVPGVHGNGPSTVTRVVTGLATNPVDDLITEFLPDFAKRVHIRIVFVQQILNNVSGQPR